LPRAFSKKLFATKILFQVDEIREKVTCRGPQHPKKFGRNGGELEFPD
jgi:hypothetical protein